LPASTIPNLHPVLSVGRPEKAVCADPFTGHLSLAGEKIATGTTREPNEKKNHGCDAVEDPSLAQADRAPKLKDIDGGCGHQKQPRESGEEPIEHVPQACGLPRMDQGHPYTVLIPRGSGGGRLR
jgi:hypothetical protein